MKNLHLFNIKQLENNKITFDYEIYGEKKDEIHLSFSFLANEPSKELDRYFIIICQFLYQIKYINKKILSISEDLSFRYFGGTPEHLIKNLSKYTFNLNEFI